MGGADYPSAKIGFKNDGSGKLANGNVTWNSTGDVSIKGNFESGTSNSIFKATSVGIQLGHATFADAPFSVTSGGVLKSVSGVIGS